MDVLSIKSPPTKRATVKRQVFESIGIPYLDDSLRSPSTVKVMNSPSNRHPLVSCSGETRNDSRRIQSSGVSSHEPETARRRRDSLDRVKIFSLTASMMFFTYSTAFVVLIFL